MALIDSHCHIDFPEFDADRDAVLAGCRTLGVERIVVPGVSAATWDRLLAVCAGEPMLVPALGLHPVLLEEHEERHLGKLERRLGETPVVAVGEIGLDFQIRDSDREAQLALCEAQLVIAREAGLPVILHVRKAHEEMLGQLGRIRPPGGIVHAFNGSLQQAARYRDLGFRLGFGGTLTFDNARHIHELARELPLSDIVLETDAPDMSPAGHRGERNSPEYLPEILAALAAVREADAEALAAATAANARAVLGLS
jgi:TatD DNase family protein